MRLVPRCQRTLVAKLFIFNDSCQTSHLKIYGTDLTKFSGLVELRLQIVNLKLVFRSLKGRCHGNHFLVSSTELSLFRRASSFSGAAVRDTVGPTVACVGSTNKKQKQNI